MAAGATPIDDAPRPGQPRHDGRLHPPQGQLRDADRARPGVSASAAIDGRDASTPPAVAAPPAAVLWDMDGTLVDTEPYWMECEHELVAAFGGTWTDDDARSIIGFDLLDAAAVLRDRGGVALEPHEIVERLLDGVIARVRERVPWRPGRPPAAGRAQRPGRAVRARHDVVGRLADAVVEALAPITFQAVVTGDAVRHGKPHPEPYLRAAAAARRRPARSAWRSRTRRPASPRPAPPGASSSPCPTSSPIDAGAGPDHRRQPEGRPHRRPRRARRRDAAAGTQLPPGAAAEPRRQRRRGADPRRRRHRRRRRRRRDRPSRAATAVTTAPPRASRAPSTSTPGRRTGRSTTPCRSCEARADTLHQLSPFWFRATGVDTIEVEPNTPTDEAEEFLDVARDRDVPARRVDPRRHRGRRDGRHPRRPGAARPPRRRHRRASPPTATSTASTSTTSSSPSPTAGTRGRRRGRTGSPSSASSPSGCTPTGAR